ncbi:MAG TPA: hypothetical protein VLB80_02765 [Candidatus Babeliales bacterium]|nr:hypothetical protein [Candidatus Babeliales bacterium]
MLKKLVKYGNSNALILDRAILELLNIKEGAIVKLHTDGISLIITPHKPEDSTNLWMEGLENLNDNKNYQQVQATNKPTLQSDTAINLSKAIDSIMKKYQNDLDLLTTESFLHKFHALTEKYKGDTSSPEFIKNFQTLRLQEAPNLAKFDKEMQNISEQHSKKDPVKYTKMKEWGPETDNNKKLSQAIKDIAKKYTEDLAVLQSEAFLYDVDLLVKKYKDDKSSPEFMNDFFALRLRYTPNIIHYDQEIQKALKDLNIPDNY